MTTFDSGNTAWVLTSCALVLLMTPGLAFFYAGMVKPKNVLSVLTQNFVVMGIVSVLWVIIGYTLAFGPDAFGGFVGNLHYIGLGNLSEPIAGYTEELAQTIPPTVFISFQLMFAIITPALFTGSIAERMKFTPFILVVILWSLLVYSPIAHWVFSPEGWLFQRGALDFAGGTVVHMNAGAAGLALAIVLGKRVGWPTAADGPRNNVPFVLLGAGLLWFGWFGFNAGSALGANELAGAAFIATNTATGAALLSWLLAERLRGGKPTALGAASGAIAGLVAITPAAGFVNPVGALLIGLLAGFICCYACSLKYRFRFDDTLDVVGIHLIGGLLGALAIGFLKTSDDEGEGGGILYGGDFSLLKEQIIAVVVVFLYSFIVTYVIAKVIDLTLGLKATDEEQEAGLDLSEHDEVAYDFGYGPGSLGGGASEADASRRKSGEAERTGGRSS